MRHHHNPTHDATPFIAPAPIFLPLSRTPPVQTYLTADGLILHEQMPTDTGNRSFFKKDNYTPASAESHYFTNDHSPPINFSTPHPANSIPHPAYQASNTETMATLNIGDIPASTRPTIDPHAIYEELDTHFHIPLLPSLEDMTTALHGRIVTSAIWNDEAQLVCQPLNATTQLGVTRGAVQLKQSGFLVLEVSCVGIPDNTLTDLSKSMTEWALDLRIRENRGIGRTCLNPMSERLLQERAWWQTVCHIGDPENIIMKIMLLATNSQAMFLAPIGGDTVEPGAPATSRATRIHSDWTQYSYNIPGFLGVSVATTDVGLNDAPMYVYMKIGESLPIMLNRGDVLIRDITLLHRGSAYEVSNAMPANETSIPRSLACFRFFNIEAVMSG